MGIQLRTTHNLFSVFAVIYIGGSYARGKEREVYL